MKKAYLDGLSTLVSIPYRYAKNEHRFIPDYGTIPVFQFLIGTLKTYFNSRHFLPAVRVSIPYRYAKN